MKIKCSLICRVTETFKNGQTFEIALYDAHHYSNIDAFKVEYLLRISRINKKHEVLETLKETEWFIKPKKVEDRTRFISFADVTFAYLEKSDQIYLQQDFITV